ncbi:MAG: carboxypeptidase regulatory-like domain-containing protein [Gemmatimonadota bacterium]|nr:carboxypeptidase regulatory-like domain-containing protein [Gemmatimonadota bacterium]MDH3422207.1 carboxypeptidase regulatory-like domain-containing protein [Gemmatimonadota bacterium]
MHAATTKSRVGPWTSSLLLLGVAFLAGPRPAAAQIAERLYQEACDSGDFSACTIFGLMAELGRDIPQDFERARALYLRGCEGGELVACTNLGLMYEEGVGGAQDFEAARGRYRIACEGFEQLACDLLVALDRSEAGAGDERRYFKRGRVADAETTTALSNALVEVPALEIQQVSNRQGQVTLGRLPEGRYVLRVERLGYAVLVGELEVPGGSQFLILMEREEAPDPDAPGRIEGQVTDGGTEEIRDVDISVVGQDGIRTLSDRRGYFTLTGLEPGLVQVRFARIGYAPRTATLVVQPGLTSEITATMAPRAVELAPIEVTVRSEFLERNGFYDRTREGRGRQLNRLDLDRIDPVEISEVLQQLPGVRLQRSTNLGAPALALSPRVSSLSNGECILDVYIDGVRMSSQDLNQIPPDWLDAMEVYVGAQVPIQYAGLNPCGVVLLWTRR